MYLKKPYNVIKNAVHDHSTVAKLIPTMLQEVQALK